MRGRPGPCGPGGGAPVVTGGPDPETKEFLVGYWIVDCESPERACELAARFPDRRRPRA
ncbi:YciI family protein, partial [Spinactinospora alkalitolerans]|uniref:YciI family protein n=1 Tax=Spinactinospora alkalitolerans TaxID=687207 RepID=UPI0031DA6042